jgi:uncharacterized protein YdhG (YjbR/CyaY superfamily)
LTPVIKWNQAMFLNENTYIIDFSISKKYISVAAERATIIKFSKLISNAGYIHSKELFQINWDAEVNYKLLANIIKTNIKEKEEYTSFWRV